MCVFEVALSMAGRPRLLLLDEPMAGLSSGERAAMLQLLARLDPAIAVLLIEHDMNVAFAFADRVTVLAPALVADVANVIRRLKDEGTAVLLVEQNAAFAVKVADAVHVMSKGTIVHSSAPAALWQNEDVKTQYLGVPK